MPPLPLLFLEHVLVGIKVSGGIADNLFPSVSISTLGNSL